MSHSRTHILALHGFSSYGQDWHFCTSVSLNQDFPVFKTMCKIYPWQRICLNCAKFQTVEQFYFTNWCSALEEKDCWFNQLSLFSLLVLVIAVIQKEGTLQCPWFDLSAMKNDCRRFFSVSPRGWSKVRPKLVVIWEGKRYTVVSQIKHTWYTCMWSLQGICIGNSSPCSNESLSRMRLFCCEATRRRKLWVGLICRYFQIFRPMWLSSRVTSAQLSQY